MSKFPHVNLTSPTDINFDHEGEVKGKGRGNYVKFSIAVQCVAGMTGENKGLV